MSDPVLPPEARRTIEAWRSAGEKLVFTNGVYDLLHRGHLEYLQEARALGDRLIVGVNGDESVRRLKGESRPIVSQADRLALIRGLGCVDMAVLFEDDTPERLVREVNPHVLVKGADWRADAIVGRDFVESSGGRVVRIALRPGLSTSALIERIRTGQSASQG